MGATSVVASLITLGAFVVSATNLALRSQTFGLFCFAAIVAILAQRRKHPLLLWLIPLLMLIWANTHGSFFIGWVAIGIAALEDVVARSRLAWVTVSVSIVAVIATLLNPWGLAMWQYVIDLSTNPLVSAVISEWQPTTLQSPTGLFFFGSAALVLVLLLARGRAISWLQVAWLAVLAVVGVMAVRGVAWWAIGAAPVVAMLVDGLTIRGRALSDDGIDRRRSPAYTVIAGVLIVCALAVLPAWRPNDASGGPQGMLRDAPSGVTAALRTHATPDDRLFAEQAWASWFELAVPGLPVMVDSRVELFDHRILGDYLHVTGARADWQQILDGWGVSLLAIRAGASSQLIPFLEHDDDWVALYEDDEGRVYRRSRSQD